MAEPIAAPCRSRLFTGIERDYQVTGSRSIRRLPTRGRSVIEYCTTLVR
jgi:hypothetical protein